MSRPACALFCALLLAAPSRGELIYGLTTEGGLVTFDSASPGVTTPAVRITGRAVTDAAFGEPVLGIDVLPDGTLVALTRQEIGVNFGRGRVYAVDPLTGAATLLSRPDGLRNAAGNEVLLTDTDVRVYGFDYDPLTGDLVIVSGGVSDLNLHVTAGGTGPVVVGPRLLGVAGENVGVRAAAHDAAGTLYGVEPSLFGLDRLRRIDPATGRVADVGPLGFNVGPGSDFGLGFDISPASGVAYLSAAPVGVLGPDVLYVVDLATGEATPVGEVVLPFSSLRDVAVAAPAFHSPEPSALALLGGAAAGLVGWGWRRQRRS